MPFTSSSAARTESTSDFFPFSSSAATSDHTPGGTAHQNHQNFEHYYFNNGTENDGKKYHEAVLDLYFKAAREALAISS